MSELPLPLSAPVNLIQMAEINRRHNLLMPGYGFCGLSFMALLSPSLDLTIDYCSLQARGHMLLQSGAGGGGWALLDVLTDK